jgi:hypothetical protein
MVQPLSERDILVLQIMKAHPRSQGVRERVARERLGLTGTAFHQLANAIIDTEAALAHDPLLVNGLRRLREGRVRGSGRRHRLAS